MDFKILWLQNWFPEKWNQKNEFEKKIKIEFIQFIFQFVEANRDLFLGVVQHFYFCAITVRFSFSIN